MPSLHGTVMLIEKLCVLLLDYMEDNRISILVRDEVQW